MIYSIMNQKGGVAKTTSTFNIGAILAEKGKKVLLVDLDPQHSLTIALGIDSNIYENSSNLSGGEVQKICQARLFLKNSELIILDEPTEALDSMGIEILKDILNELKTNKIIILISHNKEFAKFSDKIVEFGKQEVIEGIL